MVGPAPKLRTVDVTCRVARALDEDLRRTYEAAWDNVSRLPSRVEPLQMVETSHRRNTRQHRRAKWAKSSDLRA